MLRKIVIALTGRDSLTTGHRIDDAASRRLAWLHYLLVDHGFLRYRWTNFAEIAPGVFRSNHPHESRLKAYRDQQGIRAVLNLRGANDTPAYMLEEKACRDLGLELVSVAFAARAAPKREKLLALFDAFDTIQRPFVIHCKSGADRAGLVSVLYLLDQGVPLAEARVHLSLRYLHLKHTKTGIQDAFLDVYAARLEKSPISIRDWVNTEYNPEDVRALFASRRTLNL